MQILSDEAGVLYAKLVRLAGGDTGIVMQALAKPNRTSVQLGDVVKEIKELRAGRQAAPHLPATAVKA